MGVFSPTLTPPFERKFQDLLRVAEDVAGAGGAAGLAGATVGQKLKKAASQKLQRAREYEQSHRVGEAVWKTGPLLTALSDRKSPGNMHEESWKEHVAALAERSKEQDLHEKPFDEGRSAAATYASPGAEANLDRELALILGGAANDAGVVVRPNDRQAAFLRHFVKRMKVEQLEMQLGNVNAAAGEPLLDLIHGFPGTGKSAVIFWLRRLMEEGLGWKHGVQFVCLAFQNAMASQIKGFTVHHWSGIPTRNEDGSATGDRHKQSMKCQALRVIIIDEVRGVRRGPGGRRISSVEGER